MRLQLLSILVWLAILPGCNSSKFEYGKPVPNITMQSPEGKTLSLKDLKGNIVLIDFWASWCKPCRNNSPQLVKLYDRYANATFKEANGFNIFSVSFDTDKEAWINAIEQDGLKWDYHVSDLKGFNSEIRNFYPVRSIPYYLLIDHKGNLIGEDLTIKEINLLLQERLAN